MRPSLASPLTGPETFGQSLPGDTATPMGQSGERGPLHGAALSVPPPADPPAGTSAQLGPSEAAAIAEAHPVDDVMHRYARGDDAALDELYRLGAPRVRSFLARLCADLALAEDLTQDAFLRIHAARGTFARGAPALPWMFAIARNSYRDHLRRENVRRAHRADAAMAASAERLDMRENGGDRAVMARQMLGVVQEALMGLPVRQREAFVLFRFEGLSLVEAAAVLGATEAAVKILVHRAYAVVRAALEAQDPDSGRR